MTQIATVEQVLNNGFVTISVPRKSACGHDCEECAGCGMTGAAIKATAQDPIGVQVGQKVVVESSTKKLLGVVALVYVLPVVFFLLGYFLSYSLTNETLRYIIAIAAAAVTMIPIFLYDRYAKRHQALTYTVQRVF
jgi:sigma-E factor negative regulatory protein RseC